MYINLIFIINVYTFALLDCYFINYNIITVLVYLLFHRDNTIHEHFIERYT